MSEPVYDSAVYDPGPMPGTLVCSLDGNVIAAQLADQHDVTHGLPAYGMPAQQPAAPAAADLAGAPDQAAAEVTPDGD